MQRNTSISYKLIELSHGKCLLLEAHCQNFILAVLSIKNGLGNIVIAPFGRH